MSPRQTRGEVVARGITPRRTRLVRVPDLQTYRRALTHLSVPSDFSAAHSRVVLVPTRGAASLVNAQVQKASGSPAAPLPHVLTRDELYDLLNDRLPDPLPRLTAYARDAMMQSAAREASSAVNPRPGLVAEMLRFYDQLRRQGKNITRFEELLIDTLSKEADFDRGAERLLAQTRILVGAFHGYERRVAGSGMGDEHVLRTQLLTTPSAAPVREIVVTLGDWIADPDGIYLADFDLLSRLPGLESIDILATDRLLATGFQQRVHEWLPGIEEVTAAALGVPIAEHRPTLLVPHPDDQFFVARDREEELVAVARRLASQAIQESATAVVFKRPLPYLYLASTVFGGAHLPYRTFDQLPLAAEPFAAALDLVFEFVESGFTRRSLTALLSSPHFAFEHDGRMIDRASVGLLDRALSDSRYLGGQDRLSDLAATTRNDDARAALRVASRLAEHLSPLTTAAPASAQVRVVQSFLENHCAQFAEGDLFAARSLRARSAIRETLTRLEQARANHDDAPVAIGELAADVRRWIEDQTFEPETSATSGIHLLDDRAARYADLDHIAIVGLVEHEWPERPRRNIFYPQALLTALGWPSEQDRRSAAQARFLDLLASAARTVSVSTITLDDEALVEPSGLVDDIPLARLSTALPSGAGDRRVFTEEALSLDPVDVEALDPNEREWAALRHARTSGEAPAFHGFVATGRGPSSWSVSALETYLECPFKFFARDVLKLEEEPEDAEIMDPRAQGAFVHKVFEAFFKRWQASLHQAITMENIDAARAMFAEVVEERLRSLSDTEAALERTRLLGSAAAAGLGEAVLRMEAERPVPVVDRALEYWMDGEFSFASDAGPRTVFLKGKADRIDLLADGTFRLIDYKLGWPPDKSRSLQLPIYALCAEQRLDGRLGRRWTLGEAAYLAFKGPRRVVPLIGTRDDRDAVFARAQRRLLDTVDAIGRGEFPPRPDDVYRCDTCTYAAVCRKDYVGDV